MPGFAVRAALCALLALAAGGRQAAASDQTTTGPGNDAAVALSAKSPLVKSAKGFLLQEVALIGNAELREETRDAIAKDAPCVRHRAGLYGERKAAILDLLIAQGLVAPEDDARVPGGL